MGPSGGGDSDAAWQTVYGALFCHGVFDRTAGKYPIVARIDTALDLDLRRKELERGKQPSLSGGTSARLCYVDEEVDDFGPCGLKYPAQWPGAAATDGNSLLCLHMSGNGKKIVFVAHSPYAALAA